MKKLNLLPIALVAGLAFTACSENNIAEDSFWGSDGSNYINLSLNLPTQKGNVTRAENDKLGDGVASEYKVNSGNLLLFKGADATNPTFLQNVKISLNWNNDLDDDHITTQGNKVVKVSAINKGSDKIYAVVVLNGAEDEILASTYTDYNTFLTATKDLSRGDAPYMSNAILSGQAGVDTAPSTSTALIDVTDKIYSSESEAAAKPAAEVFVERGCAKVTVSNDITESGADEITLGTDKIKVKVIGFALANTNTTSYMMRHWKDKWFSLSSTGGLAANPYRFAGIKQINDEKGNNNSEITNPTGTYYRTYFGEDVNYNEDATFAAPPTNADDYTTGAKYCNENTFDVDRQKIKNTTCAIVKVTFDMPTGWDEETHFYTIGDDKTRIYKESSIKTMFANQAIKLKKSVIDGSEYAGYNFDASNATIVLGTKDKDGYIAASKITLVGRHATLEDKTITITEAELPTIKTAVAAKQYTKGAAYYTIPIKHFGDDLTPWSDTTEGGVSKTEPYEGTDAAKNANYLGRYGVLRNNWYDISVTKVSGLGNAVPDEVHNDGTWDDDINNYISVKINVLSWAKRKQEAELK